MIYRDKWNKQSNTKESTMPEHYSVNNGVTLNAISKAKVKKIADDFHAQTSKDIVVTSGTRSASSQADAMYKKFSQGGSYTIYKNHTAAKEIYDIYTNSEPNTDKNKIISAMEEKITEQINDQNYISKHLKSGAVDIRSRDMSNNEKATFKKVAKPYASVIILETKPPHFHLSL